MLVDEYQDTNHAQYALIHQLCADDARGADVGRARETRASGSTPAELMVVGDADQSIYAFRGANIRNILDFEQDFPNATSILLEQNYRSTQTILNAANAVIGHNQGRKPKNGSGPTPATAPDRRLRRRRRARRGPVRLRARSTRSPTRGAPGPATWRSSTAPTPSPGCSRRCSSALGMPYKVVGGVRFYERREVRDALAYLRMLVNPADEVSLRRILNTPKRGIGDRAVACVDVAGRARADHVLGGAAPGRRGARAGHPVAERRSRASSALVEELQSMVDAGERADVILESVLARSGYLAELEASDDPQDDTRVENLAELVAVAREFSDDPVAGPVGRPGRRRRRHRRRPGCPTSWSGSRWSPTPTRSPTHPATTTAAWSP